MTDLYLGIDLGTSGCRIIAIDNNGTIHGQSSRALPAPLRNGDAVEQDPQLWWAAVQEALHDLLNSLPGDDGAAVAPGILNPSLRSPATLAEPFARALPCASQVRAIAVDGTSATLLLTDDAGHPLCPALMYHDARSTQQAVQIKRIAPHESGAHGATSALAKLLYLQQQSVPPSHRSSHGMPRHAMHQADWITGQLSGHFGISDENNALKLGYDTVKREWPAWLDKLGINRKLLPEVLPPGTPIGTITVQIQREFGLPPDTRVVTGTTDSTAAFLATGAHSAGQAVTSLGSTLVIKIISPKPIFAPTYGIYSHRFGDLWLAGGASNSGGAVLLKYFTQDQLTAMTPQLKPAQDTGLNYYPLLVPGERFPVCDATYAPRLTPRPADDLQFFQGMLESIAHIEQQGYQRLAELGGPNPTEVYTAGSGARNKAWQEIRQRILNVPIHDAKQQDAAYGAALLAKGLFK